MFTLSHNKCGHRKTKTSRTERKEKEKGGEYLGQQENKSWESDSMKEGHSELISYLLF